MQLKSLILATALVVASGMNGAIAATANLVDWSAQGGSNDANVYASGYSAYLNQSWSWDGGATPFVSGGNSTNNYQSPFNTVQPATGANSYFAVGGGVGGNGEASSPVTLNFNKTLTNDTFKILWGSIDTYNSITFWNGLTELGTILGQDIINLVVGAGGVPAGGTNSELVALLTITGVAGATHAVFSSSQAALEFALAPVPIPPALLLFGTALAGMGLLSRRRRQSVA